MDKCIYILLVISVVVGACSITRKYETGSIRKNDEYICHMQILSIDTCKDVYNLKCLDINNFNVLFAVSLKENIYSAPNTSKLSTMQIGGVYTFELKKMRIRVSTMQQFGQFIIARTDTLWHGVSKLIPPDYYMIKNSLGLKCWKCDDNVSN